MAAARRRGARAAGSTALPAERRAVRVARAAARLERRAPLCDAARARAVCRHRGPRNAAARPTSVCGVRTRPGRARPYPWMGLPEGRCAAACRRARELPPVARGRACGRRRSPVHRRCASARPALRLVASPLSARGRAPAAAGVSAPARAVPLRRRRLQDGLGARRADSLARRRMRARRHRAPRRHVRGDCARRGSGLARRDSRSSVHPARPAEPLRPDARAGRPTHGLGVLPRAVRLDRRHAGAHRDADRAVRSRVSRPGARARRPHPGGSRAPEPEPGRRGHRRRRLHAHAVVPSAYVADVLDAGRRAVSLLGVHAPRRRCARHVRLPRRKACAQGRDARVVRG